MPYSCCRWRINAKTGSLSIGILYLVASLSVLIMLALALWKIEYEFYTNALKYTYIRDMEIARKEILAIFVVDIATYMTQFVCSITLIIGCIKKEARLVLPWIVIQLVLLPVRVAHLVSSSVSSSVSSVRFVDPHRWTLYFFTAVARVVVTIYFMMVVHNLYRKLKAIPVPSVPNNQGKSV